jgi:hypothetical protein
MKIVEFFLIIWGKWSEQHGAGAGIFTSWSRSQSQSWSRTKMDRLRNTALDYCIIIVWAGGMWVETTG